MMPLNTAASPEITGLPGRFEGIEELPLPRAVKRFELLFAAESLGAMHRDEALPERRKRQSSLER